MQGKGLKIALRASERFSAEANPLPCDVIRSRCMESLLTTSADLRISYVTTSLSGWRWVKGLVRPADAKRRGLGPLMQRSPKYPSKGGWLPKGRPTPYQTGLD